MSLNQLNIFITKTPYHVLLAHAALKVDDLLIGESVLIYYGEKEADIESIIDRTIWKSVHFFSFPTTKISRKSIQKAHRFLSQENLESAEVLFTCNDVNWRSQIFITRINYSKYYVAEDGLGAYLDYRRTFLGWCYAEIFLRILYPSVTFHYGKMNQSRADLYLSLTDSAFPWRENYTKRLILREFSNYCHKISANQTGTSGRLSLATAILITQPLSDQGHWSYSKELHTYTKMLNTLSRGEQLVVKKHPAESSRSFHKKVDFLSRKFNRLDVQPIESKLPVEVICQALAPASKVFSIMSTGAINISMLRPDLEVFCDSSWENKLGEHWPIKFL